MASSDQKSLIIMGAGGFGIEAAWVAQEMGLKVLGFVDDNPEMKGKTIADLPVLGTPEQAAKEGLTEVHYYLALGKNKVKEKVSARLEAMNWRPITLIHPSAVIGKGVVIGAGSFVGPLTIVAPYARLEKYVLVNASAGVGHHATLGAFTQVCPGARVNGYCSVDKLAFIGSNSVLNPGVRIGESATVGSSSLVIRNVPPLVTVLGVPARVISRPAENESPASI